LSHFHSLTITDKNTRNFYRNAISKRLQEIEEDETEENLNERGWFTDAFEKRDVAIFDVPGAYSFADLDDKFVLSKIEEDFVKIMCDVNSDFVEDIVYENEKPVLYVQILKALYGMIESALLWYLLYIEVLLKHGFELNPVDKCVANKIIDGKQCTIGLHVDDNMISHVKTSAVDDILKLIEGYFPGLQIQTGRKLDFLGLEVEFRDDGEASVGTVQYLTNIIETLDEELDTKLEHNAYSTPVANTLFKRTIGSKLLGEKKADIFRRFVPMVLWAMKRCRPDCEITVSF